MKLHAILLLTSLLTGCAVGPAIAPADADARDLGELRLNRPLTVPAHRGWIYIQDGQVYDSAGYISLQGLDQYYTNCRLELRRASSSTVRLQPDRFRIVGLDHNQEFVQRMPLMVAALDNQWASAATRVVMSTSFYLRSAQQPEVWRLRCAHWEDPWDAVYPSMAQIRKTLGEVFTLQPPP